MKSKKAKSLDLQEKKQYCWIIDVYCNLCFDTQVVSYNLINLWEILQERKNSFSNRGHTVLFRWSQLDEGCLLYLLSLSSIFENALWREGVGTSWIFSYRYLFEIGIKDAGGLETSASNCHFGKTGRRIWKKYLAHLTASVLLTWLKMLPMEIKWSNICSLYNITEIGLWSLGTIDVYSSSCS